MKNKNWLVRTVALLLLLSVILGGCKTQTASEQKPAEDAPAMQYTVTVKTADGEALSGVAVYIYEGDESGEMVGFENTDEVGTMTFTAPQSDNLVAVLSGVPESYTVERAYPITGANTEIILSWAAMTDDDLNNVVYNLGDVVLDFTVADVNGTEYTLSELLKTKKAVVLHFWYTPCDPCDLEFPCLQEAYEAYQEDIAVLALNPEPRQEVDTILAYLEEMGITIPAAVVEEQWRNMLSVTGYPTTVIIDREGRLCLLHNGSIADAEAIKQVFEYFAAEDYESKPIADISQLVTLSDLGTEQNPHETDASKQFEITVQPGQTYHLHLYKQVEKFYLSVSGGEFNLRYKEKDYPSEKNALTLYIKPEGAFVPVKLEITNNSQEEQTYTIGKSNPRGSYSNPYSLELGEFESSVSAGNEQGTYYVYYMAEDGTLRITGLSATSGVDYGFILYNLNSYAQHTWETGGVTDEEGRPYIEIQGRKGQKIQFVVGTVPDGSNNYPACNFKLLAELNAGEVEEKYQPPVSTYTVTVTDQDGAPMKDVSIQFTGSFVHTRPVEEGEAPEEGEEPEEGKKPEEYPIEVSEILITDENGIATTEQVSGPYTAAIALPEGYKAEATQFSLTAEAPDVAVVLNKIIQRDYTVTLQYPDGTPVTGVAVMLGSDYKLTDDTGSAAFHLDEGQYSVIITGVPQGYVLPDKQDTFSFPEGESTLTVTLVGIGGKENPYLVEELPYTTKTLEAGETVYIQLTANIEDSPVLTVEGSAAAVTLGEQTYTSVEGVTEIPLTQTAEPILLGITHTGEEAKALTLKLVYPVGTKWNPEVLESLENVTLTAPEGSEKGYYYQYTSAQAGTHTLLLAEAVEGTVTVTTATDGEVSVTDTPASVYQKIDETILLHIQANGAAAVSAELTGSFEIDWNAVPDGQRVYTVTVLDPSKSPMANVLVQFKKGSTVLATVMTDAQGQAKTMLNASVYGVTLALPETGTKYYYEDKTSTFPLGVYDLTIQLVSQVPGTTTTPASTQIIGAVPILKVGTTYVSMQADVWKYYAFRVSSAGTYRISVSDPDALLVDCKTTNYILAPGKPGAAEPGISFDKSITASQAKSTIFVIAVSGTEDTLLSIVRIGDAELNPGEMPADNSWRNDYVPTASAIPTDVANPVYVDIMDQTEGKYVPVYNEADGFYHMGSKDGPVIYLDLNDTAPYVSLKVAVCGVEGSPAGGASFGRYFYDSVTGKFIRREQYDACIREYVKVLQDAKCSEDGERFYPLTHNLAYILQTGCAKWWTNPDEIVYETFQGHNPDTVWLFACCTFE